MQLYALNDQKQLVSARAAIKKKDYYCFECFSVVRLRGGIHRQNHFYHLDSNRSCELSGKSMEHIQTQCFIQSLLPSGESILECKFNEISRIADLAWVKQRIVFEIQCSPISAEEVVKRNLDYGKVGYRVVWILHDLQFNRWRMSAAEMALAKVNHYFTNIDEEGNGMIYDQYDWIDGGLRKKKLDPLPVQLNMLKEFRFGHGIKEVVPQKIKDRLFSRKLYFSGDIVDSFYGTPTDLREKYFEEVEKHENQFAKISQKKTWSERYIVKPYSHLIHYLLENACR